MVSINKKRVIKTFCAAAFLGALIISPQSSFADVPVPTLDRVKAENKNFINSSHPTYTLTELTADTTVPEGSITVSIGDKEYYYTPNEGDNTNTLQLFIADGKYYKYEAEKLPDSAYTLTETTVSDPENLPDNVITLYDKTEVIKYYDPTTGEEVAEADRQEGVEYKEVTTIETTPKYYTVSLKQTEYGDPNGTTTLTYGWEKNAEGELEFKQDPTTPVGQTISYKYNPDLFIQKVDGLTIDNPTVSDPSGTSESQPYIIEGGAGLNNPEGTTKSITNILYKDNKFTGTLNSTTSGSKYAQVSGGAVYNAGELTYITGAFINNIVDSKAIGTYGGRYNSAYGGALYNSGTVGNINADFIGNYSSSTGSNAKGGALYNSSGKIGNITGDFIGNYSSYGSGGAIYNNGYNGHAAIGDIIGNFIGNYSTSDGGAIYNRGYNGEAAIGNITGDFIGNYALGGANGGGAIFNSSGTIGDITGDFIGNYAYDAGAIYNYKGTIGVITGNFIGNHALYHGSAIYNYEGTIDGITGDFIGNYDTQYTSFVGGGVIYNRGTIRNITGDFICNYSSNYGGAIGTYDEASSIEEIIGNFIGNYTSRTGGAIYNGSDGTIGDITGDFIRNYASIGGALYNSMSTQKNITGDFIGNHSREGGAIYSTGSLTSTSIGNITGNFISNYTSYDSYHSQGGAISNSFSKFGNITGNFIENHASSDSYSYYSLGGAISNCGGTFKSITGDFIGNYAESNSSAIGGAIFNYISYDYYSTKIGLTNNNFLNNYVKTTASSSDAYTKGGAIFTNYDMTLNADNGSVLISGNYTESNGVRENNAIYIANFADKDGTIERNTTFTLNSTNNGHIQIDDIIAGGSCYYWSASILGNLRPRLHISFKGRRDRYNQPIQRC